MNAKLRLLRQIPLFAALSRDELETVALLADELDVPAGTSLTLEGEQAREFYVLVEGVATVQVDGRVVRTLVGSDHLGEIALLTRSARTATVTTVVPCRLLVLTGRAFRQLAETIRPFAAQAWASTAERLPA